MKEALNKTKYADAHVFLGYARLAFIGIRCQTLEGSEPQTPESAPSL